MRALGFLLPGAAPEDLTALARYFETSPGVVPVRALLEDPDLETFLTATTDVLELCGEQPHEPPPPPPRARSSGTGTTTGTTTSHIGLYKTVKHTRTVFLTA